MNTPLENNEALHDLQAEPPSRCKHKWETIFSFGSWGHDAKCAKCGETTTFIIRDEADQ